MPTWLIWVVVGHLLNALAFIADKFLLKSAVKSPLVYTFAVGCLGAFAAVLIPFVGLGWSSTAIVGQNLAAGAGLTLALLLFFHALARAEATRIVPAIGGLIPVVTAILAYVFLGERLLEREQLALLLLVAGTIIILIERGPSQRSRTHASSYLIAIGAALAFAATFTAIKYLYGVQPFWTAFLWQRLGSLLAALPLLLMPALRRDLVSDWRRLSGRIKGLFLVNQGFGALGFMALSVATASASVTLVNALQGLQYAFLIVLALVASLKFPSILKETFTPQALAVKLIAIAVIGGGLALLA